MKERVSRLEGAYEQLDQWLGDLMGAVRGLDAKVEALRTDIDGRFDALRHEMNSKFNTFIVVMATVGVAMVGAMFTLALRALTPPSFPPFSPLFPRKREAGPHGHCACYVTGASVLSCSHGDHGRTR